MRGDPLVWVVEFGSGARTDHGAMGEIVGISEVPLR